MRYSLFLAFCLLFSALAPAWAQQDAPLPELEIGKDRRSGTPAPDRDAGRPGAGSSALPALSFPGGAGLSSKDSAVEAQRYRACLKRSGEDAVAAIEEAQIWLTDGGGLPARHCLAIAEVAIADYPDAARNLRQMADDLRTGQDIAFDPLGADSPRLLLAGIYAQLGNVLLLDGDAVDAYTALSQGIAEAPVAEQALLVGLYVDRGRALGLAGDFALAVEDLEKARRMAPERADVLHYLASARRLLGEHDAALAAIERAIELDDSEPGFWLERGNIRMMLDDLFGARSDWLKTVSDWPESEAAEAARVNLERLYAVMEQQD